MGEADENFHCGTDPRVTDGAVLRSGDVRRERASRANAKHRAAKEESRRHGIQIRARPVARQEIRPLAECARGAETEIARLPNISRLTGERRVRAIDALGAFEHRALESARLYRQIFGKEPR